jgi:hypothetical protein
MVAAFGTGLVSKRDRRWHVDYPCLDRRTLMRSGALQPGMRTEWALKAGPGVAAALSIELTATANGLTITTGDQQQVVRYWYDTVPCGSLRLFFRCPSCQRVCKRLHFDKHWGCRVCLGLRYPIRSTPADRTLVARQIEDMRRSLIETRPGSPQWHDLLARIAAHYALLTLDVARVRRDLRRRLKNNYRR